MSNAINPEYSRKLAVAADIAACALEKGGMLALEQELADYRRMDADETIVAELQRITRATYFRL